MHKIYQDGTKAFLPAADITPAYIIATAHLAAVPGVASDLFEFFVAEQNKPMNRYIEQRKLDYCHAVLYKDESQNYTLG